MLPGLTLALSLIGIGFPAQPTARNVLLALPPPSYEYWRAPTVQTGMPDGPFGSEVTPEGDLYTGYHEFFFGYGYQNVPGRICSKSALAGGLPIYRYHQQADGGILYTTETFGTSLNGRPDGLLVNMVSVTVSNSKPWPRQAFLTAAFRYRGDSIHRPKPRLPFNPEWIYRFRNNVAMRGGRIMGVLAPGADRREGYPGQAYQGGHDPSDPKETFRFRGREAKISPTTPVLQSIYRLDLPAYGERRLIFKVPHPPAGSEDLRALFGLNYDAERRKVIRQWEGILDRAAVLHVPDRKLMRLSRASLVHMFQGRDVQGRWNVPRVNELQYDGFYLRDGAFIIRALDLYGYAREARQNLDYFLSRQKPDGRFESQAGQLDGWGQALWAFGQHGRLTGDAAFQKRTLPAVTRAVDWLTEVRGDDPYELLPAADPRDNEQIGGHLFGHDFWAYRGLWEAVDLARALGREPERVAWSRELGDYHRAIMAALKQATARTGGSIPPALEPGGYDWGNFKSVVPGMVLPPHHPWVTATLARGRRQFTEGMMTYANRDTIHGYIGFDLPMTELRRGEKARALDALLSAAAHTTAAHGGFEYGSASRREYGKNLSPHGCWSAKYLALLRDSLVREGGDALHLGSVLSPAWVAPGEVVRVEDAPTDFGPVSYTLMGTPEGARLTLGLPTGARARGLKRVLLHAPVETRIMGAKVEGGGAGWDDRSVTLMPKTKEAEILWTLPADRDRWTAAAYQRRYCLPPVVGQ